MPVNHGHDSAKELGANPASKYRSDIDGLRAVAVLAVLGFHAFPAVVPGGFIGVDVFFVISGFLISKILLETIDKKFRFVDFYVRRIRRIFPSLILVLACTFAFGWFALLGNEYRQLGKHVAGSSGFVSNLLLWKESGYFDSAGDAKPLLHLWSLGVEEQFYLVWPLLLWTGWRLRLNLLALTAFIAASSLMLSVATVHTDVTATFYSPLTRFWELLTGAAMAYVQLHPPHFPGTKKPKFRTLVGTGFATLASFVREPGLRHVPAIIGSILLLGSAFFLDKYRLFPGWWALIPAVATMLLISAPPDSWINRKLLSSRLLVWIGLISFPLYLWHWPLLSFAYILNGGTPSATTRAVALGASVVLAWLTYWFIERPIRFGGHSLAKVFSLLLMMGVVGVLGSIVYLKDGIVSRAIVLKNPSPQQNASRSNPSGPCATGPEFALVNKFCSKFTAINPVKTIVVWGDSSSAAWQTVFLDIAEQKHYTVLVISHGNCSPLLDSSASRAYRENPEKLGYCAQGIIQQQAIELIREAKPDVTVLIAAWNWLAPGKVHTPSGFAVDKSRIDLRIHDTVWELEKISKLVIFKSWPLLQSEPNYSVSRIAFLQSASEPVTVDPAKFVADNQYLGALLDSHASSRTVLFDPSDKVCIERCVSVFRGTRMYADAYHITPQGSMQFRDEIEKLLD